MQAYIPGGNPGGNPGTTQNTLRELFLHYANQLRREMAGLISQARSSLENIIGLETTFKESAKLFWFVMRPWIGKRGRGSFRKYKVNSRSCKKYC